MGGRQEHANGVSVRTQGFLQPEPRNRAVRIEQIAVFLVHAADRLDTCVVGVCRAHHILPHAVDVVVVEGPHPFEVARSADVHGIGHGADRWARLVDARAKVGRYDVIDIRRRHETTDRQTDTLRNEAGCQIAEVPARDGDDRVGAEPRQHEVVEDLREQPSKIDGVGGRQPDVLPQLFVRKRLFDESLAIVERAVHGHGRDVVAKRRHLCFLDVGDLPLRIQHDHARIGHSVKRLGDGAPRVA